MPPLLPPRRPSGVSIASGSITQTHDSSAQTNSFLSPQVAQSYGTHHPYMQPGGIDDPRSSSTQSLRPELSPGDTRRKLLLVYIHGFMGSEASFQSFPAHVHSLLISSLADSHVIHTKIYPRYQSRRDITLVRDDFSNWLAPHESDSTDVILLGHSIGGILGAEVVLEPSHTPGSDELFQHRVLGLIAFDTPFLGMHPGVVSTGIASLFRGAPEEASLGQGQVSTNNPSGFFDFSTNDPNYNPAYTNDVVIPVRKNKWERAWYFWNKHADDLGKATKSYVKSHFEFGGCLADYPGLKRRYLTLRALEDVEDLEEQKGPNGKLLHRVRFVNYYTASTGRIKDETRNPQTEPVIAESEMREIEPGSDGELLKPCSPSPMPQVSFDSNLDQRDQPNYSKSSEQENLSQSQSQLERKFSDSSDNNLSLDHEKHPGVRTIPAEPIPPAPVDPDLLSQSEAFKTAQKEHQRQVKAYEKAVKDREKVIKASAKAIERAERAAAKEKEKKVRREEEDRKATEQKRIERQSTLNPEDYDHQLQKEAREGRKPKEGKKKDRKFCALPDKDPRTGAVDSTWIRVYMEGMDEVVAHTSLFFVSETYAKLVGDTADRIRNWVQEDATIRTLLVEKRLGALTMAE